MNKYYDFFPQLKADAEKKFGQGGFLILYHDRAGWEFLYPPSSSGRPLIESPLLRERPNKYYQDDDKYYLKPESEWFADSDGSYYQAVANPGYPLEILDGYGLRAVDDGIAEYVRDEHVLLARLNSGDLDVWDPVELKNAPFPPILGRQWLNDSCMEEELLKRGITPQITELGHKRGTLLRLEYVKGGEPRVAYEVVMSGGDSYGSCHVVMAEPHRVDEHDLDWVYRLVTEGDHV